MFLKSINVRLNNVQNIIKIPPPSTNIEVWVWITRWGTATGCSVVTVSMISWLSSSLNQKSDHAVGDSNLNTSQYSLFLLTFSGSRSTAWFSHKLQSRGASAWKKLMIVCTSHYLLSLAALQCCVEILRCSIRLYTSFHYASLSNFCDQIRVTISFGNIFELWYVYMEKIISV